MSGPRIIVKRSVFGGFFWRCKTPGVVKCTPSVLYMCGREDSIAAAADAGRAHLAEHHAQAITPIVQTVVLSTRCTCGDLPRNAYPYFSPCPVHSYLVNTFTTTNAPAQGYCRLHGVHRGVCGCRVASVDPEPLGGRENAAQAIHDAHNGSRADA